MQNDDIEITDIDIDKIEAVMGNQIHFDAICRKIIKNLPPADFKDVQAFPGTGKTTLLIAKLGILAKKWKSTTDGICVLSFTNAAREEIQHRLGGTVYGERLLNYPHFVGTFHTFFSDFVVKPWFRSKNIRIHNIDSDITLAMRRKMIGKNRAVESRRDVVLEYSLDKDFSFSNTTRTGKIIRKIVNCSIRQGNMTYDEVLYFSNYAIEKRSEISKNISKRFPLLFIDEAQDTASTLWNLVEKSFACSDIQALGDSNQRIYESSSGSAKVIIPRQPHFQIIDSRRLTDKVASIANPLAISGEIMNGVNTEFKNVLATIIIFQKDTVARVLPTFGELILNEFSDKQLHGGEGHSCFAIGRVRKIKDMEEAQRHFPANIEAYFPSYDPNRDGNRRVKYEYFCDYVERARSLWRPGSESKPAVKIIILGLVDFLNDQSNEPQEYGVYENPFSVFSKTLRPEKLMTLRKTIRRLLFVVELSEETWVTAMLDIKLVLGDMEDFLTNEEFFMWKNFNDRNTLDIQNRSSKNRNEGNAFVYTSGERHVEIKLGSIHSVKGQTHLATLLLETYFRTHDVKKVLPLLEGKAVKSTAPQTERMALNYVALTRAEGMVCIALPEFEVSKTDQCLLRANGWNIVYA
ncbi:UvrD-helicase domain-containing protein [Levilactobacillus fujinensis]|uniref:UvrD-helicase domain-containing protein n=1 Tax=Levilactobacillus fujinensis TaxID=2486024 RepID=A0ABW1TCA7_9LACO|nr:UvrD-helicase domain-containing protein [Levilactobacillus fujinensis]